MKISLLTIWRVRNYGAEMQAYATVKILRELGHTVEMIDFRLKDINKSLRHRIENILFYFLKGNYKLLRFWKTYIPTTVCRYKSIESLKNKPPQSDCYIVGSDQVWNPEITGAADEIYFLDFGDSKVKKISYASSFGSENWTESSRTKFLVHKHIRKFYSVSCREITGVEGLRKMFDIHATNVLDPTLLFDSYPELTGKIDKKSTLAYYPLAKFDELEQFSKKLADELEIEFIVANKKTLLFNKVVWDRTSIEQWIRNIAESEFVVTQSFHGLAFSIVYNKQFIILLQDMKRSTRITSLLSQLDLECRCFTNIDDVIESRIWTKDIDYSVVNKKLMSLRSQSINYLNEVLKPM